MASQVKGTQQLTAVQLGSAIGLTIPAGADRCIVQAEGAPVRYRLDGTSPTAAIGMRLLQTDSPREFVLEVGMETVKFIAESGSPLLNVTYFGSSAP